MTCSSATRSCSALKSRWVSAKSRAFSSAVPREAAMVVSRRRSAAVNRLVRGSCTQRTPVTRSPARIGTKRPDSANSSGRPSSTMTGRSFRLSSQVFNTSGWRVRITWDGEARAEWARVRLKALAGARHPVGPFDQVLIRVVEGDKDRVQVRLLLWGGEDAHQLVAHQVDDGLKVQVSGQPLLDPVDDGQLGGALLQAAVGGLELARCARPPVSPGWPTSRRSPPPRRPGWPARPAGPGPRGRSGRSSR